MPQVLACIHGVVNDMVTPSWLQSVPHKFGNKSSGTLKANEWCIMTMVYLPVALMSFWGTGTIHGSSSNAIHLHAVLHHNMDLVCAVSIACLHVCVPWHLIKGTLIFSISSLGHRGWRTFTHLVTIQSMDIWLFTYTILFNSLDLFGPGGVSHLNSWLDTCSTLPITTSMVNLRLLWQRLSCKVPDFVSGSTVWIVLQS